MEPYRVCIASRQVERQVAGVARADRSAYERIRAAVEALGQTPRPTGCVKLSGTDDLYRLRIGDWRVIYRVDDAAREVVVAKVARRSEQTYG